MSTFEHKCYGYAAGRRAIKHVAGVPLADGPDEDLRCHGPVSEYTSRSGATTAWRCERHQQMHDAMMEEVERGLQERYPGYDVPGSAPPSWFDPTYAGERWDDDY